MDAQKVTIFDVAKRAGVSISSVSAALNETPGVSSATRERIRTIADELGFRPSLRGRSLSGRRAFALGFVIQRAPDVLEIDPFFGAFIGGVEEVIDSRGYALVLHVGSDLDESLKRYRRLAGESRVDGVFLTDLTRDDPRVDLVHELGLPAVGINADPGFPLPAVRQDHAPAISDLVTQLVAQGHTRIGHVAGRPELIHSVQRRAAWEDAMRAHGLEPGPVLDGRFSYAGGAEAAQEWAALPSRPTAMFCANDLSALGFTSAVQQAGFDVPHDVAVAGYDGIELGRYANPPLATVVTSPRQLALHASELLLELVDAAAGRDVGPRTVTDVEVAPARLETREPVSTLSRS
ncbi:LacI family DNA-binding transcriptional regulator [Brachybacterium sp. NPDC056505]|uniref:LacI family DNA-binding transcriptional regulator n=1 Tax=Brachybacterium sp. NPDC056505 TaxID=3345843 RepID=UPI003670D521